VLDDDFRAPGAPLDVDASLMRHLKQVEQRGPSRDTIALEEGEVSRRDLPSLLWCLKFTAQSRALLRYELDIDRVVPGACGKRIAKIAPNGVPGLADMVPQWDAITRRQIESPSPMPSFFVV